MQAHLARLAYARIGVILLDLTAFSVFFLRFSPKFHQKKKNMGFFTAIRRAELHKIDILFSSFQSTPAAQRATYTASSRRQIVNR